MHASMSFGTAFLAGWHVATGLCRAARATRWQQRAVASWCAGSADPPRRGRQGLAWYRAPKKRWSTASLPPGDRGGVMNVPPRKSCPRCKHVSCTCRGGGGNNAAQSHDDDELMLEPSSTRSVGSTQNVTDVAPEDMLLLKEDGAAAGAEAMEVEGDDKTKEPKVGDVLLALWRPEADDWREVEIKDKKKDNTQFYVHWADFNRRLDSWIDRSRLDLDTTKEKLREVRERRHKWDEFTHENHDDHEGLGEADLKEHEELTKVKNVNKVQFGRYIVETWYFTPLPREIWKQGDDVIDVLYICEFTLNFYKTKEELERHQKKLSIRHPPGNEIYRNGNVSVFEVDGEKAKIWCQNLCYIAKMFLDHKYLYYDVDPFLFYIICESDEQGFHVVGYFSKEKESANAYNLACILTLPQHQRKGYGKFIISFSYALSRIEQKLGSPEKPLSDLGKVSYESYWARQLLLMLQQIRQSPDPEQRVVSINELAERTSFTHLDIKNTLERLKIIRYKEGSHYINVNPKIIEYHLSKCGGEGVPVDPSKIHWAPHVSTDRWYR